MEKLLYNPDRGFRIESNMNILSGGHEINGDDGRDVFDYEFVRYDRPDENPQLIQTYFYLSDYITRDLKQDDIAFVNMRNFLEHVKASGKKVILRFSYFIDREGLIIEHEVGPWEPIVEKYPTLVQMIQHMDAIGESGLLEEYKDYIHSVQAGFVGVWGEWNYMERDIYKDAKYEGEPAETALLRHWLAVVPEELPVQVRWVDIKDQAIASGFSEADIHATSFSLTHNVR